MRALLARPIELTGTVNIEGRFQTSRTGLPLIMVQATVSGVPVDIQIQNPITAQPSGPVTTASVVGNTTNPANAWRTGEFDACDERLTGVFFSSPSERRRRPGAGICTNSYIVT